MPIIRSWALTRGFALHPGTRNRYEIRDTRTQDRPPSRQVNDHGRVSGTHRAARLEPLADRHRMKPQLLRDLPVRPALVLERMQVHVLLLVHHESGGPFSSASMLGRSTR